MGIHRFFKTQANPLSYQISVFTWVSRFHQCLMMLYSSLARVDPELNWQWQFLEEGFWCSTFKSYITSQQTSEELISSELQLLLDAANLMSVSSKVKEQPSPNRAVWVILETGAGWRIIFQTVTVIWPQSPGSVHTQSLLTTWPSLPPPCTVWLSGPGSRTQDTLSGSFAVLFTDLCSSVVTPPSRDTHRVVYDAVIKVIHENIHKYSFNAVTTWHVATKSRGGGKPSLGVTCCSSPDEAWPVVSGWSTVASCGEACVSSLRQRE